MLVDTKKQIHAKPVPQKIVQVAQELKEMRAELRELEARKKRLTTVLEEEFGKNEMDNTADYSELVHRNIKFATLSWVTRSGVNREKLETDYPEAYEACRTTNTYSVVKL